MSDMVLDATDIRTNTVRFCEDCRQMLAVPLTKKDMTIDWLGMAPTALRKGAAYWHHRSREDREPRCELCVLIGERLGGLEKNRHKIRAFALPDDPASELVDVSNPPCDFASDAVFERAKKWMRVCQKSHKQCRVTGRSGLPYLPTRVIDVGDKNDPGFKPSTVRLYESGEPQRNQYACLSYCWGGDQYKLARDNLKELQAGISEKRLSRTIADAVEVTRRLGLRYLWVDALCIVQNDDEDKAREIAQMGATYKNAVVTIAAAGAKSANEGFLSPRLTFPWVAVRVPLPNGEMGTIRLSYPEIFSVGNRRSPEFNPLDGRGWAFQEALLSQRRMVFSAFGVELLCQLESGEFITDPPFGERKAQLRIAGRVFNDLRLPPGLFGGEPKLAMIGRLGGHFVEPYIDRLQLWHSLVHDFSARQLLYSADRLAALAGIAGELQRLWKDDYVFGMWRKLLGQMLLWKAPKRPGRRLTIAPTWSWASTDAVIEFLLWDVRLVDVEVTYDAPAKAGSVPLLTATGTLVPPSESDRKEMPTFRDTETFEGWWDTDEEIDVDDRSYLVVERRKQRMYYIPDKELVRGAKIVRTTFLVLKSVGENTYARVGIAQHAQKYTHWRDTESKFSKLLKGPKVRIQLV